MITKVGQSFLLCFTQFFSSALPEILILGAFPSGEHQGFICLSFVKSVMLVVGLFNDCLSPLWHKIHECRDHV